MELHKKIGNAALDLLYLIEREYPRKASIELVGNRYRMSAQDRMVLYRGVFPREVCESRMRKRLKKTCDRPDRCVIDCYNVFITIESYLQGRLVFRALDGFVRDVSGVYGNYSFGELTKRTARLLLQAMNGFLDKRTAVFFYLDYPVSRSGEFAAFLREKLEEEWTQSRVEVVKSPDMTIRKKHARDLIATSDTIVIDAAECCLDLPDLVLHGIMGKEIPDLQRLMKKDLPWIHDLL